MLEKDRAKVRSFSFGVGYCLWLEPGGTALHIDGQMTGAQTILSDLVVEELKILPHTLLEDLIAEKLESLGIPAKELSSKLAEHALSGSTENFVWDSNSDDTRDITISISNDDIAKIKRKLNHFAKERLPLIVRTASEQCASDLLSSLKKQWPEQHAWEKYTIAQFRENLEARWGKGINLLRLLLSICLEVGHENLKKHKRSKLRRATHSSEVLIRLHARACQVSAEIIVLIESGFADGAMARWRTLHEIAVVAAIIHDFGEETAERYVSHQFVEAKAAMDEYVRSSANLGYEPISKRSSTRILKDFEQALKKYGKEFSSPYGWAAKDLKKKKPIFPDLEAAAGRALLRSFYKMASYNVHATARGAFLRLSHLDSTGIVAGATNAGMTDPAQHTAASLTLITLLLFGPRWRFEDIVTMQVLLKIRDDIPGAFFRAERKLRRDDTLFRRRQKVRRKSS